MHLAHPARAKIPNPDVFNGHGRLRIAALLFESKRLEQVAGFLERERFRCDRGRRRRVVTWLRRHHGAQNKAQLRNQPFDKLRGVLALAGFGLERRQLSD